MAAYYDIETFLDTIPADFDTWNTSEKLLYYGRHIYGFQEFSDEQQVRLADEYSTNQLKTLWRYYQVPKTFGFLSADLKDARTANVFMGWALENLRWILEMLGVFDDNGTIYTQECEAYQQEFNEFIIFLLVPTFVFILFVSFLKTRKSLYHQFLHGRPGVQYPLNLIDENSKGWAYSAVFVIMVYSILWMFDSNTYFYPRTYEHEQFADEWGWKFVSVLLKLLNVLHIGVIAYPLFESITLRRYIFMNVVGIGYMIAWIYYMVRKYIECNPFDQIPEYGSKSKLHAAIDIPNLLAILFLTISYTTDLILNIKKLLPTHTENQKNIPSSSFLRLEPIIYLRGLLRRTKEQHRGTLSKRKRLQYALSLIKIDGLKYSPRVVCTMTVAVVGLFRIVIALDHEARHIRSQIFHYLNLFKPLIDILSPNPNRYEEVKETINTFYWSFYTAMWCSVALHSCYAIHMIISYRKHIRMLLQGNHKWHVDVEDDPTSTLTAGMRYSGYQIAYIISGFLVIMIGQTLGGVLLAYLIILPLKHWEINVLLEYLVGLLPEIVVGFALFFIQLLLVRLFFVQEKGKTLALDNRRMYHVMSYFMFFPNILVGLGSCLRRFFTSLVFGFVLISRMDRCILMKECESFDAGHKTYLSMLKMEIYHKHPLLKAFVLLLTKETESSKLHRMSSTLKISPDSHVESGEIGYSQMIGEKVLSAHEQNASTSRRNRLRWYKAYTLIRNPSLIRDTRWKVEKEEIGAEAGENTHNGVVNVAFELATVSINVAVEDRFTPL